MTNLEELITSIELHINAGSYSEVTFPTLKKLSINDVITIWSSVSKHVSQQLLKTKPKAVSVSGLGTFHIKKWLSFENGKVQTFQRPVFVPSRTVAQICELQHASVTLPGEMKKVLVNYKKIQSDVPYAEDVVQNCMQETLNFFYFIVTNEEDADFVLKDVGTLAIRGREVRMGFCEDFLLSLNKSTYVVEKLLAKKWVISDKEVTHSPSCFGHVHEFPQFEIRAVPLRTSLSDKEMFPEFKQAVRSVGVREAVRHTSHLLQRDVSLDQLARAEMEKEADKKTEGKWPPGRPLPERAGTEGRPHKETPFKSPELPLPTSEERTQTGWEMQCVLGLKGIPKLKASMAKRTEKVKRKAQWITTFPELPQQRDWRESYKMQRTQLSQGQGDSLSFLETTSNTEKGLQTREAWFQGRRQFRTELESLEELEKWLTHKPFLSRQEKRCWQRIKACRADRRAAARSAETDILNYAPPKSTQPRKKGEVPLVYAPYPQALVRLHDLLHKEKLSMVTVFERAGMGTRKIRRADFIQVIKEVHREQKSNELLQLCLILLHDNPEQTEETKVPISDKDLEDVVIFLTSSKPGNFTSLQDLTECQKQWLKMCKGQSPETKADVEAQLQKATCKTATSPPSAGDTANEMKPHAPTKPERDLMYLEVPPVNTEPEQRHLTYDEMEEIGKLSRERRRREKNKDTPIEWKEKCRMVRSGDGCLDGHCLPTTVENDLGELLDQYRRNAVMSYLEISKLCRKHKVHISEAMLQRALLHPGDRIIKEGEDVRKIRQPGVYYSTGRTDASPSPVESSTSSLETAPVSIQETSQTSKETNRRVQRNKKQKPTHSNFWPGHLLDKLYLYFPEKQHDRAHALFSCVRPTKPAYHGF